MGWTEFTDDGKPNPRHTVWHDIRHWGPSLLGEAGFSSDFIRHLTGHASREMADHYTHLRESKLEEAVGHYSEVDGGFGNLYARIYKGDTLVLMHHIKVVIKWSG